MSFFEELKRRNVFKVAIAYVVMAWLMAQVAELLLETFGAPDWVLKTLLMLFLIGFPFALFFAWAFELTPEGIKKEKDVDRTQSITSDTGQRLNYAIIAVLVVALGYFAWDKFATPRVELSEPLQIVVSSDLDEPVEPVLPTDKSIAVLPFDNRSNQDEDEFFTSGIHDDLLTQLAQISSLRVISRTSVAQFKDTTKSIREIAGLLGVATILEGGVQRAGDQVRINMQLIDASTDAHLWAQTYDRQLTANNIFSIQSEIATAVTDAMRATLSPEEKTRISAVPTENMEALEEYFKGRAEIDQRTLPSIESARMRFERARELDPDFALAYAGEAQAILLLSDSDTSYGEIPEEESNSLARPLLQKALDLAPMDAQVLAVFGLLEANEYNYDQALDYYRRSVALNPSNGEVLNWQRMAQFGSGRMKESSETSMRMLEVDPMSMITLFNGVLNMARIEGHDELTVEMILQRLEGLNRGYGLSARGGVERARGNIPMAASYFYQALELDPGRRPTRLSLMRLLGELGLEEEARLVKPDETQLIAFLTGDWETAIQQEYDDLEKNPDSEDALYGVFYYLVMSGDAEKAYPYALKLWERFKQRPLELGSAASYMTWVATVTEHPQQALVFNEVGNKWLQAVLESGAVSDYVYLNQAMVLLLNGQEEAAITALSNSIDKGMRWQHELTLAIYDPLRDNPRFQAQANRLRDVIRSDSGEILTMLCGPETILTSWEPAPETCEQYRQEAAIGN